VINQAVFTFFALWGFNNSQIAVAERSWTMFGFVKSKETLYPNRFGHDFFLAVEEVVGKSYTQSFLSKANLSEFINNYPPANDERKFSPNVPSKMYVAYSSTLGGRGSRTAFLRVGRVLVGLLSKSNPLFVEAISKARASGVSLPEKLETALEALVQYLNTFEPDLAKWSNADETNYLVTMKHSLTCLDRQSTMPEGSMVIGMIQELGRQVSGGKEFRVTETQCCLMGAATCVFQLDNEPIG
jgi:predicted hydrocarbon binding protein